jgi:catechol 2,3-dioxygenase
LTRGRGSIGTREQNYLYFRDPVGLRYELNSGGYRNHVPDWEPVIWRPEQGSNNAYRTEIEMPAVGLVAIPAGVAGSSARMMDLSVDTAEAALARS